MIIFAILGIKLTHPFDLATSVMNLFMALRGEVEGRQRAV
jgi:hypothetical protein